MNAGCIFGDRMKERRPKWPGEDWIRRDQKYMERENKMSYNQPQCLGHNPALPQFPYYEVVLLFSMSNLNSHYTDGMS
jgi:hypothetical protein